MTTAVVEEQKQVCKDKCKAKAKAKDMEVVGELIEKALTMFDAMIRKTEILEIDAYLEKGDPISGKDFTAEEPGFKIVNHALENAYFVPIDKIVRASHDDMKGIVIALVDGVFERLDGVTRIVGYYSRVRNWNASKIGELRDRVAGRINGGYYIDKKNQKETPTETN